MSSTKTTMKKVMKNGPKNDLIIYPYNFFMDNEKFPDEPKAKLD
jgi:hypothetical protein